jgi:hypothetical protein
VEDIIIPIVVPLIFYIFLSVIILVPVFLYYRFKSATRRLVSEALAKGQQIDPEVLARLVAPSPSNPYQSAFWFAVAGLLFAAIACGLAVTGVMYPELDATEAADQLGAAIILGFVGVGFLLISAIAFFVFKPRRHE